MTGPDPTTDPDLADADRTRLTKLLAVETDPRLQPTSESLPALAGAVWSTGLVDADAGIDLNAYFIPDPVARAESASRAADTAPEGGTVQVATNGALLLVVVASSANSDERTLDRVREILTRFAGKE